MCVRVCVSHTHTLLTSLDLSLDLTLSTSLSPLNLSLSTSLDHTHTHNFSLTLNTLPLPLLSGTDFEFPVPKPAVLGWCSLGAGQQTGGGAPHLCSRTAKDWPIPTQKRTALCKLRPPIKQTKYLPQPTPRPSVAVSNVKKSASPGTLRSQHSIACDPSRKAQYN